MCRSAVLNTEWLRIHSSFEQSLWDLTTTNSEYGNSPEILVATCLNEVSTSSATSFSSFLKTKINELVYDEKFMKNDEYFWLILIWTFPQ